jgi:hypothetical protein
MKGRDSVPHAHIQSIFDRGIIHWMKPNFQEDSNITWGDFEMVSTFCVRFPRWTSIALRPVKSWYTKYLLYTTGIFRGFNKPEMAETQHMICSPKQNRHCSNYFLFWYSGHMLLFTYHWKAEGGLEAGDRKNVLPDTGNFFRLPFLILNLAEADVCLHWSSKTHFLCQSKQGILKTWFKHNFEVI